MRKYLFSFLAIFLLAGCATWFAPKDTADVIGSGYAGVTTTAHDVEAARLSGVISDVQADGLKDQLNVVLDSLDVAATAVVAGHDAEAASKAAQAHAALQVVITALKQVEATKGGH